MEAPQSGSLIFFVSHTAVGPEGSNFFSDGKCLKNGSSQDHCLALTVVCMPNSIDCGMGPHLKRKRSRVFRRVQGVAIRVQSSGSRVEGSAVERLWHIQDSQGQFLALAFR